jgi:hypothetical protein
MIRVRCTRCSIPLNKQVTDRTILTYSWFEGDRPVCHLFWVLSVTCFGSLFWSAFVALVYQGV